MITGIKRIDHRSATRTLYELDGTTPRGERIGVEFSAHINDGSKHDLCQVWYKAGFTPAPLPSYWCVNTYAYVKDLVEKQAIARATYRRPSSTNLIDEYV